MAQDPIELSVAEVRTAVPAGPGIEAGLILLRENQYPNRYLRMYVGRPEAKAVEAAVKGDLPMRPSTWDLLVSSVAVLEGRVTEAMIIDVREGRHFYAQLAVRNAGSDLLYLTARPSDAIAIALRAHGCVINAMPDVLDQAGLLADGTRWDPADAPAEYNTGRQQGGSEADSNGTGESNRAGTEVDQYPSAMSLAALAGNDQEASAGSAKTGSKPKKKPASDKKSSTTDKVAKKKAATKKSAAKKSAAKKEGSKKSAGNKSAGSKKKSEGSKKAKAGLKAPNF